MAITDTPDVDESDVALIRRTRAGDRDAYGQLHVRHGAAAVAVARRMSRSTSDADDLVSEGFARVLAALQRGAGPDVAFRPYLLSTIRRLAYDRTSREQREAPVEYDMEGTAAGLGDPVVEGFERDTAAAAFASLPERWRMVLWHTEVEGQSATEVAALLGMKPNAVAALAYRAREGLRQAYLSHHATAGSGASLECRAVNDRLAAYIRDGLSPAQRARVSDHLDDCEECAAAHLELASVNTSLRGLVGFVVLGPLWAAYVDEAAGFLLPAAATATATAAGGAAAASAGGGATSGVASVAASSASSTAAGSGAAASGSTSAGGAAATAWWPPKAGPQAVAVVAALVVAVAIGAAALVGSGRGGDPAAAPPAEARTSASASDDDRDPGRTSDPDRAATAASDPSADTPADPGPDPEPAADGSPADPATPPAPEAPRSDDGPSEAPGAVPDPAPRPGDAPTAPATTVPAPSPTTTTPPPPPPPPPVPPSALSAEVASAGSIVSGRPGVVVVTARNAGEGPGVDAVVEVDLGDLSLRGMPITGDRSADRGAPWTCDSTAPTRLVCRSAEVDPASSHVFYVPVLTPVADGSTSVVVAISGVDDPGTSGVAAEIPIRASGMAARFAVVDRGGIAFAGNTLVTCPESHPSCADARAGVGSILDNGSFAMQMLDAVPEMGARNSSSATVELPAGAQVLSAQLYWGGGLTGGSGGSPALEPDQQGSALLRGPDGTTARVTAERVDVDGAAYQATADVTELVAGSAAGTWSVGDVQIGSGTGAHGGWGLAVVYHHDGSPLRSLVLLDGLSRVGAGTSVELELGGFAVPAGGATSATLDVLVHEGDAGLSGDQLSVAGTVLSDGSNPLGNTFNSTASDRGEARPGMDPAHRNLFGLDIDRFDIAAALTPGSTSVTVEFSTSADVYLPGVVAFVVDQ